MYPEQDAVLLQVFKLLEKWEYGLYEDSLTNIAMNWKTT
jgi:hypothetical protein